MPSLDVKIPPMGESISSGVLAKWHVKDGDVVKRDQPLFELETDKITSEGTAESDGKISLKVAVGAEVKIGQVVASIDTAAAGPAAPTAAPAGATSAAASTNKGADLPQSPAVRRVAGETGVDPNSVSGSGKGGRVTKGDMLAAASATSAPVPASGSSAPAPAASAAPSR